MAQPLLYASGDYDPGDLQSLTLEILQATSRHTGENFFAAMVRALVGSTGLHGAFIGELTLNPNVLSVLAANVNGRDLEPLDYGLGGTGCEAVVHSGTATISRDARRQLPRDECLRQFHADSFAGVVLRSESGDTIGALYVIHDRPMRNAGLILALLESLAPRAASELERRLRDLSLRRSETRLRLLVEQSRDILFFYQMEPEPGFQYVSPAAEAITGYPREAFHANPNLALRLIHEDDRARVLNAIAVASEEPIVARLVRADGQIAWMEYRDFPVYDNSGRLTAIGGAMRDITARVQGQEALRRSEEYRRALLNALPDTTLLLEQNGELIDVLPGEALQEQLGDAQEAVGRNILEFLPSPMSGAVRQLLQAAARERQIQVQEVEDSLEDDARSYEFRCLPFGENQILLIIRDFTARRWHAGEEERRRLRDEIDQRVEQRIRGNPYNLTYRELAVLHLVVEGSADKKIAESLGISIYTVNKHVGNILSKMNAASRTEASVRAVREGLV